MRITGQVLNSALDANASAPLTGIGPGTFEFWWARNGDLYSFARDAHSLVLETLAELGIIGLILIVSFIAVVLGGGSSSREISRSTCGQARGGDRLVLAFIVAAAVDWIWELPALPVAFLLLARQSWSGPHCEDGEAGEGMSVGHGSGRAAR